MAIFSNNNSNSSVAPTFAGCLQIVLCCLVIVAALLRLHCYRLLVYLSRVLWVFTIVVIVVVCYLAFVDKMSTLRLAAVIGIKRQADARLQLCMSECVCLSVSKRVVGEGS